MPPKTALVLPEPMPFVLQTSLDDFYVSIRLMRTRTTNQSTLISIKIFKMFAMKEIEIMSPHYRAARDGNKTTIPEI
jgi:hypothetical protein